MRQESHVVIGMDLRQTVLAVSRPVPEAQRLDDGGFCVVGVSARTTS
jgi:hypothetical protein